MTVMGGGPAGGAEAFFVALNRALKRAGFPLHAVLRNTPIHVQALADAGIAFQTLPFAGPLDLWTTLRLGVIARRFRPDVVLTFAGRASAHMPKGRYAIVGRLGGYYNLRRFRHCDWLVGNSPDVVRHIVEGGWPKERVSLIPNFPQLDDAPTVARKTLDTPEDVPVALAMGRFHTNKGFDVLLKAVAQIPRLWLWLAGEGEEEANLKRLAQELGIESRLRFLGWRMDRAALYRAADVVIYPSRQEPFGNVVVEAWSVGTPLVATASAGPAWLVKNREDGILVPVDDAAALAAAVKEMISSPELAARLVAAGKKRVAAEFSEEAIVAQYRALFERVRLPR